MKHQFSLGSFHWENGTTFSEIPFIPGNFQWNEPKSRVHLHPNRNSRSVLVNGKPSCSRVCLYLHGTEKLPYSS